MKVIIAAVTLAATIRPAAGEQSADTNEAFRLDKAIISLLPMPPKNSSFQVYWENDGTFVKPNYRTDRHYTEGLKFVYTHQPEWGWLKDFGTWNNFGEGDEVDTAVGYFFGQNMYTPDHADDPASRSSTDRVFAAWLNGGIFAQRATQKKMEHFELNVGIIGPSALGGEVQSFIHNLVDQPEPNGWDDQLNDEFAIDFTWLRRERADGLLFKRTENFDSFIEYGFTAGSLHRNANVGYMLRLGTKLPNDFGPGRLEQPYCATGAIGEKQIYVYFFGRANAKFVQYDRFLTGLDTRPVVGQFQLGVVWRYKSFEISYAQTFLTHEFEGQQGEDSYGSLNASIYF
ncbi:MAG: lipid A deacylase LpxR family protein [Planctomycetota bacterium]